MPELCKQAWSFKATLDAPRLARAAMRAFLGDGSMPRATFDAVILCVSEAVTNAVLHAYTDLPDPGDVVLEARRSDADVCVLVRDAGHGLRPRIASPGLGVGLPLISQLATATEIRTPEAGGTEVVMRFDVAA